MSDLIISELTNPEYRLPSDDWEKWRSTYESGTQFINNYLERFSSREENADFEKRKKISYVPAFAKAAVNDVKDAIFQRISDVTRGGGPETYSNGVLGLEGGVDLAGTTMNSFVGTSLLPELLTMKKVGVFVDMPQLPGGTISDQSNARPYIYSYKVEDILNWTVDPKNNKTYTKLLLRDFVPVTCDITGLPTDIVTQYRFLWVEDGKVQVQFFDEDSQPITQTGEFGTEVITLEISTIPFVLFEITDSLLRDASDYQIALLNLASSDMSYSLQSNFPFYLEQFDPRAENLFRRPAGLNVSSSDTTTTIIQGGEQEDAVAAKNYEARVGATAGRRIPKGLDFPKFIHPSAEPLMASMAKQEELKKDIRMIVKLAVSNLAPKMASAESKGFDERGLEAGLSAIGLELEQGERAIAQYWRAYDSAEANEATVKYPQKYSLQSDQDRRSEAKDLIEASKTIPSVLFKKETLKQAAVISLGTKITHEKLVDITDEIEAANVIVNPDELHRDIELGLIDPEAASIAKGYPTGSVEKAAIAHAERVCRIAESQAKARGVDDLGGTQNASRDEKMGKDLEEIAEKKTRGEA